MLIPSAAFAPVSAPTYPMVVLEAHFAVPSPLGRTASAGVAMDVNTGRLIFGAVVAFVPEPVFAHPASARPTTARAAAPTRSLVLIIVVLSCLPMLCCFASHGATSRRGKANGSPDNTLERQGKSVVQRQ